jgi:hypothetical protein
MQLTITNRHGVVVLRTEDTREIALDPGRRVVVG